MGTISCTGSIMPYMVSYIGIKSGYVSMNTMTIVFYISQLSWSLSFLVASYIQNRFSPKIPIYIGTSIYILVVFLTSALTNYIAVIVVYGVLLGFGCGFTCFSGLYIAINCYPHRRGLVAGTTIGIYAVGSCVFNFISLAIVNPENQKPSLLIEVNGVKEKFFSEEIASNVPKMFWVLGGIYSAFIFTALLMIKDIEKKPEKKGKTEPNIHEENHLKVKDDLHDESSREHSHSNSRMHSEMEEVRKEESSNKEKEYANPELNLTIFQCLRTRQFYQVFFATLFSGTAGMFAIASFKTIGIQYGYDDTFLTITGSLGSIANGTNRPLWGCLFDKKSYRLTFMIICVLQIGVCFSFPSVNMYKATFFIWICILNSCAGGTYTVLLPLALRVYGKEIGPKVYSCFTLALGLAAIFVYIIQMYVVVYTGQNTFFYILGGLSSCSFISNLFFKEKIDWK